MQDLRVQYVKTLIIKSCTCQSNTAYAYIFLYTGYFFCSHNFCRNIAVMFLSVCFFSLQTGPQCGVGLLRRHVHQRRAGGQTGGDQNGGCRSRCPPIPCSFRLHR